MVNPKTTPGTDPSVLLRAPDQYDRAWGVDQVFAAIAKTAPEAVAIKTAAGAISYGALNIRINAIASALAADGVNAGDHVAILLPRGPDLIASQFATMRLGGAYAPLDIAAPAATHRLQLELLKPAAVIEAGSPVLTAAGDPNWRAPTAAAGGDVAAIMFTSGSTGAPKGVRVRHRGIVRLVRAQSFARFGPATCFLCAAPPAFDAAHLEIYAALLNGGAVAPLETTQPSLDEIAAAVRAHAVTDIWLTAGLFHLAVDERPDLFVGLSRVFAGGDVISARHLRAAQQRHPNVTFINGYGPTENTTFTTCYVAPPQGWGDGPTPIGSPLAHGRLIIDGAPEGELLVAGDGVAAGYLGGDDQGRFRPDPDVPGALIYATGDMVRQRVDSALDFLGRHDRQIKIAGRRVELNAVEALLRSAPGVTDAAVLVETDGRGEKRLRAFCTPTAADPAAIRAFLNANAAPNEQPHLVHVIDRLPLGPTGKLDRAALARSIPQAPSTTTSGIDPRLAEAFTAVIEGFDPARSFADNGVTSLQMVRVHARITSEFPSATIAALYEGADLVALSRQLLGQTSVRTDQRDRAKAASRTQANAKARRLNVRDAE